MVGSHDRPASARDDDSPVGIVSGGGTLPYAVAAATQRHGRRVVLFGLRGFADAERVATYPHHWISLGQFGRLCRLASREGCRDLVFIGTVVRPALSQLRLDFDSLMLVPRAIGLFRGGDGHLLAGVAGMFEERGFRVVGAHEIAPEILMPEGTVGARRPGEEDRADIARGLALLHATGPFDVGQAVVVAGGQILAIEAAEGTDLMLDRVAQLRRDRPAPARIGVLVKAPKRGQDPRVDLPTIGPETIERVVRAGLAGLAVTAGGAIVAERERVSAAADAAGIFVVGVTGISNQ
jgi:DUF1009 family protein